jgi:hypothetical protein
MTMIKLTYEHIRTCLGGDYHGYADEIEEKFPGDGVDLNDATAEFFTEHHYCLSGGAMVIISSVLGEGEEAHKSYAKWNLVPDDEIYHSDARRLPPPERTKLRWKALFDFVEKLAARNAAQTDAIAQIAAATPGPQVVPGSEAPAEAHDCAREACAED